MAVHRHLDQQRVDQVLDVPGLVGRQVAEAHHELLHHAHRHRRHLDDLPCHLLRALQQLGVRHHLVDQADAQRLAGVDRLVGEQHLHRVDVAELLDQEAGAGAVAEPALAGQRELELRVLFAGDADVGRGQQDVEAGARGPAVHRGDHRLPHPRIVVAHAPVDAGLLSMHGARQRPEDALRAQVFALVLGDVGPRREIVAAAEVAVAFAGQDRAADVAILPQVGPGFGDRIRRRLVEDIGLVGIGERDVGDAVALLIFDGHGRFLDCCPDWRGVSDRACAGVNTRSRMHLAPGWRNVPPLSRLPMRC